MPPKEIPLSTQKPGRRSKASIALLAIVAMLGTMMALTLPASADTAATLVVTRATTPYQSTVAPNGPLTGLRDGDAVTVNVSADGTGTPANLIFEADVRLCRAGLNIQLLSQFNASAGNCITNPLSAASSSIVQKPFGAPNTGGNVTFLVGTGTETVHTGIGSPITCDSTHACAIWVRQVVPTGIVASGNAFVHYDVTFAGAPDAPVTPTVVAHPGSATVSWTAPTFTGNWPLQGYTVTSSPGGLTCSATAPTTTCDVPGLDPFTSYTFAVTATNQHPVTSVAGYTSTAATTTPAVIPAATTPAITTAVPHNGMVTVSWTATQPAPTSYTVSSKQGALVGPTCTTATTSCDVSGLTNGKPYVFKVTANYAGGMTVSAPSAATTPKVFADLTASNAAALTTPRSGVLNVTESVTNNGPEAAPGKMLFTVGNATESAITPDAGVTCGPTVPNLLGTGFTQLCTTDAPLASGATLNVGLALAPQANLHLTSITVRNAVSLPLTTPASYSDPVVANNSASKTIKVIDNFDLQVASAGGVTIGRTGTYVSDATLTNTGTDAVFAKFTVTVTNAAEAAFLPDAAFTCAAAKPNAAGTGFSRVCTTTAPLAPATPLLVHLELTPNTSPLVHGLTVTFAGAKLFGNTVDPTPLDNKSLLKVAIADSADLATTLSAPSSVSRAGTVTITGTITNNGPDAVTGKAIVKIVGGTITSGTADVGLNCVGVGATRTCTITTAIAAGTTLNFSIVVTPSAKTTVTSITATSTASVLGGVTVSDPSSGNNVATIPVAIV
jgi:hypothetical protein